MMIDDGVVDHGDAVPRESVYLPFCTVGCCLTVEGGQFIGGLVMRTCRLCNLQGIYNTGLTVDTRTPLHSIPAGDTLTQATPPPGSPVRPYLGTPPYKVTSAILSA